MHHCAFMAPCSAEFIYYCLIPPSPVHLRLQLSVVISIYLNLRSVALVCVRVPPGTPCIK